MPLLTQGKRLSPGRAKKAGFVDAVVDPDELSRPPRTWILEEGTATQPWDQRKFKLPGGAVQSPKGYETFVGGAAMLQRETWGVYPAPKAIMACVYHGAQMPLDQGLKVEAREFIGLARGDVAQNMIRTLFFHRNAPTSSRAAPPTSPPRSTPGWACSARG